MENEIRKQSLPVSVCPRPPVLSSCTSVLILDFVDVLYPAYGFLPPLAPSKKEYL